MALPEGARLAQTRSAVTDRLRELRAGDADATERLFGLVYSHLRRIAHNALRRERPDHTLATSDLVHEAYLKLVDQTRVEWQDRAHFFAVTSRVMRRILVDYARRRVTGKRGHGPRRVPLLDEVLTLDERADSLLELDEAITRLHALDDRLGRVVEYRFFGGLNEEETAEVLGVTARTVRRDWVKARGWLYEALNSPGSMETPSGGG